MKRLSVKELYEKRVQAAIVSLSLNEDEYELQCQHGGEVLRDAKRRIEHSRIAAKVWAERADRVRPVSLEHPSVMVSDEGRAG